MSGIVGGVSGVGGLGGGFAVVVGLGGDWSALLFSSSLLLKTAASASFHVGIFHTEVNLDVAAGVVDMVGVAVGVVDIAEAVVAFTHIDRSLMIISVGALLALALFSRNLAASVAVPW